MDGEWDMDLISLKDQAMAMLPINYDFMLHLDLACYRKRSRHLHQRLCAKRIKDQAKAAAQTAKQTKAVRKKRGSPAITISPSTPRAPAKSATKKAKDKGS